MSTFVKRFSFLSHKLHPKYEINNSKLRLISSLSYIRLNQAQNLQNAPYLPKIKLEQNTLADNSATDAEIQDYRPLEFSPSKHLTQLPLNQLVRSYFILNLCRKQLLVNNALSLINLSRNICGSYITKWVIKSSFFKHFCAGETPDEVINLMNKMQSQGIGSILDYAAEKDFNGDISMDSTAYFNNVKNNLMDSIFQTSHQELGFIALKMTALLPVEDIYKASNCILKSHNAYEILTNQNNLSTAGNIYKDKVIFDDLDLENFLSKGISSFKDGTDLNSLFYSIINSSTYPVDKINYYLWMQYFSPDNPSNLNKLKSIQSLEELPNNQQWLEGKNRLEEIMKHAENYINTAILIDAEQSYFQPAIDQITTELQEKFNRKRSIVYNTYQAYRKDTISRALADMNRAKIFNYKFGVKLVRGAYMNLERSLTKTSYLQDPIYPTIEQTHTSFNSLVKILLTSSESPYLCLATHNEDSIRLAAEIQQSSHINKENITFAQLFGMADHITHSLSENKFRVYKYLPYGPVFEILPYLIRRAEENIDVMAGSSQEITNIKKEILSRANPVKWSG